MSHHSLCRKFDSRIADQIKIQQILFFFFSFHTGMIKFSTINCDLLRLGDIDIWRGKLV